MLQLSDNLGSTNEVELNQSNTNEPELNQSNTNEQETNGQELNQTNISQTPLIYSKSQFYPRTRSQDLRNINFTLEKDTMKFIENQIKTNNFETNDIRTLKILKMRNNLKIVKADKSNILIIFNKKDYDTIALKSLNNERTYQLKDEQFYLESIKNIRNHIIKYKNVLHQKEIICLLNQNPTISKFRLLPKLHKSKKFEIICQTNSNIE